MLRQVDRFVDLEGVRPKLTPLYSEMGLLSVCPEPMVRMLLVGYLFGISPTVGPARKSASTSLTGGSAGSGSMAWWLITRLSRRRGTAASVTAISSVSSSTRWSSVAWPKGSSAGKLSRWMAA